jgi:hypothetical protein
LKPPCVELIQVIASLGRAPNAKREAIQSLEKLLKVLREVAARPENLDAKISEFVFVPISHVLRASRNVPVRALELCLECISILLKTGWNGNLSPELSGQLLILFTFLANPSSAENGITSTSEELQGAAFKCMAEVLTETTRTTQGRQLLTATKNIPALGKAVLVMVDSLAEVPSTDVRMQALAALHALSAGIEDLDALASFLPRMISSLTKVLTPTSSARSHFRLLESGLNAISLLFSRVLSDRATKDLPTEPAKGDSQDGEDVHRTTAWLHATAAQVKIALANVFKLRKHDKTEVRHALLQLCLRIIQECRTSLSNCTGMAVETLISLAGRGENDSAVTELKILLSSDLKLAELLRESLHGWIISLPRIMQSKDDDNRHQIIHQISVTVRLLREEQIDLNLVDDLLAANLRNGFTNVLQDSKNARSIIETSASTDNTALVIGDSGSRSFQPLKLRFKGQDEMIGEFQQLLQELAKSDSGVTVAHDLIRSIESGTEEMQLSTFWLAVSLVRNVFKHNAAIDDFLDFGGPNLQAELLDELYALSLSKLTTNEDSASELHWRFQALSLEVVALQATRYKADFRVELIETLYPVLHILGSSNIALQNHAMTCLNILADSCEYSSARELIVSNVDYIVNAVGLKLNYHDISPQAPQVLLMMMRLCGPDLLPYLDDLVGSMFSALERYHGYPKLVELLFSVLRGMTEEGVKTPQLLITASEANALEKRAWKETRMNEVVNLVKSVRDEALKRDEEHEHTSQNFPQRPWKDTVGDQPTEGEEENQDEAVQKKESPPPAPRTFDMLLKISELTQHYLTSSSPSLRTSLLSLLQTTIPALAKHENSFLPLINTLWPVLLPRLEDPEAYVVSNALDIMAMMCTYAGDFMKGRIEATWETVQTISRQSARSTTARNIRSRTKSPGLLLHPASDERAFRAESEVDNYQPEKYVDAPTRMIRESFIQLMCTVAKHVAIREDLYDDIIDMLDPVISRDDVRQALESRNPDALWLRLFRKSNLLTSNSGIETIHSADKPTALPTGKPHWNFVQIPIQT